MGPPHNANSWIRPCY